MVGGGNVAVDVALTARRMGAAEVHMVCLEKSDEMPASKWEIEQTIEEGVKIHPSWGPEADKDQRTAQCKASSSSGAASVFDEVGRFNPTFNESIIRKTYGADMVILAIGQSTETDFLQELPEVELGAAAGSRRTPSRSPVRASRHIRGRRHRDRP